MSKNVCVSYNSFSNNEIAWKFWSYRPLLPRRFTEHINQIFSTHFFSVLRSSFSGGEMRARSQCPHLTTRLSSITTTITGQEITGSKTQSDLLTMGVKTPETC
jgi:hypothetical protein